MQRIHIPVVLLFLLVPALSFGAGKECINWAKVMTLQEINAMPQGKVVVVESFTDYTKTPGDEWMEAGLPSLAASMLSASTDLRVLSGLQVKYAPEGSGPEYIISGMFQHVEGGLRVFVKLMAGADRKLLSQYEIVAPYPDNSEMFSDFAAVTKQIWSFIKVKGDETNLNLVRDQTPSPRAFEAYIKGRQSLESYKMDEMEVAKTWFEQTKRTDYRSPLGYEGLTDLYNFLGYYHKQRGEPFGPYFQQAEAEISDMTRLAKRPPVVWVMQKKPTKKEKDVLKLTNRFLLGHASFNEGLIASQAGNSEAAAAALKKAVEYVPEDAIAWYHLSGIYQNLGNAAESSAAMQKAYEINPCLGK